MITCTLLFLGKFISTDATRESQGSYHTGYRPIAVDHLLSELNIGKTSSALHLAEINTAITGEVSYRRYFMQTGTVE